MSALSLVFLGTPEIACPSLAALHQAGHHIAAVITQPDRPAGRGMRLSRCATATLAEKLGLPLLQPQRIREVEAELKALAPDALVVVAFGQILPQAILDIPRLGAINLHTSLLPALRGAAPISRAIMNGLDITGVSAMFMDAGMDTGDVILQESAPILPQDTGLSLGGRLGLMGAGLLLTTLDLLSRGQAPRVPQDPKLATYAPMLSKAEGRVDFARPAREVDWLVRGADPWPGAFAHWQGQPLKLFAPTLVLESEHGEAPGTILPPDPANPDFMMIACGRGVLGIGQAQAAGKKRMAGGQFLRGARLGPGAAQCLGSHSGSGDAYLRSSRRGSR